MENPHQKLENRLGVVNEPHQEPQSTVWDIVVIILSLCLTNKGAVTTHRGDLLSCKCIEILQKLGLHPRLTGGAYSASHTHSWILGSEGSVEQKARKGSIEQELKERRRGGGRVEVTPPAKIEQTQQRLVGTEVKAAAPAVKIIKFICVSVQVFAINGLNC